MSDVASFRFPGILVSDMPVDELVTKLAVGVNECMNMCVAGIGSGSTAKKKEKHSIDKCN